MHSRIFQLERKALTEDDYIDSGSIPEWFTNSIADYTSDACSREHDIGWLMTDGIGDIATVDGNKLTFSSDVRKYFREKYETFIKAAEKLLKTTFDDFVSGYPVESAFFILRDAFNDRYGFYVYSDDGFFDTLDNFMHRVKGGETYFIGGIVDYHF